MAIQSMNTKGTRMANRFAQMMVLSGRFTSPPMNEIE